MQQTKVAIAISGQARPLITYRGKDWSGDLNEKLVRPNNADVFCAFWHDKNSDAALEEFKPKAYLLPDPEEFQSVKQKFFDDFCALAIANLKDVDIDWLLDERLKYLNGEIWSEKHKIPLVRDNTLRMFWMMDRVMSLIGDEYDYVVRTRPDLYFDQIGEIIINRIPNGTIANNYWMSDKHKIRACDHFFYSTPANMRTVCDWSKFPERVLGFDLLNMQPIREKQPGSVAGWMHPETILHHIINWEVGLEFYGDKVFGTGVSRSVEFPGHRPETPVRIVRNI